MQIHSWQKNAKIYFIAQIKAGGKLHTDTKKFPFSFSSVFSFLNEGIAFKAFTSKDLFTELGYITL